MRGVDEFVVCSYVRCMLLAVCSERIGASLSCISSHESVAVLEAGIEVAPEITQQLRCGGRKCARAPKLAALCCKRALPRTGIIIFLEMRRTTTVC